MGRRMYEDLQQSGKQAYITAAAEQVHLQSEVKNLVDEVDAETLRTIKDLLGKS